MEPNKHLFIFFVQFVIVTSIIIKAIKMWIQENFCFDKQNKQTEN